MRLSGLTLVVLLLTAPALGQPLTTASHRPWGDLALTGVSLTTGAIAAGITFTCLEAEDCREVNEIMRRIFHGDPLKGLAVKVGVNLALHWIVLRYWPPSRLRTAALALVAGINTWDAGHDIREIRRRRR